MTKKFCYDVYHVSIPTDFIQDTMNIHPLKWMDIINQMSFVLAEEQSKLYAIPCTWYIRDADYKTGNFTVIRKRTYHPNIYIITYWETWVYDVWGNRQDGYEVNDRFNMSRCYPLKLKVETFNKGTSLEFKGAYPTDYQLKNVFGVSCKLDLMGDDINIYVNRDSDGYPIGELTCISHESLSPIRPVKDFQPG